MIDKGFIFAVPPAAAQLPFARFCTGFGERLFSSEPVETIFLFQEDHAFTGKQSQLRKILSSLDDRNEALMRKIDELFYDPFFF